MYRWDFDTTARQTFADLGPMAREALAAFMGAVVVVDPLQYQRDPGEPVDRLKALRTLPFGQHNEGLVTFLVYQPDDLVLVVQIQWLGQ
jgi:hypothetical protein